MKTENVTLADCKTKLFHSPTLGLDSLHIDIKCTELSQIQRLISICGGELAIFAAILTHTEQHENIYWVRWSSIGNVYLTAMLNIDEKTSDLLIAGLGGNNGVFFTAPTKMTMIDNCYLVLPDDKTLYRSTHTDTRGIKPQERE